MFSIEAIPHFHALPLQALPCLFSFLPILNLSQSSLSEWRQNRFSDTWGWLLPPDSLTTGSHASNRAGLGLRWCPFPYPALITAHRVAQG